AGGDPKAHLVREGDIAADYLEGLLDIADLDGDLDLDVEGDRAVVSIVGGDLGNLVGRHGEVLDALQELTRLAVLRETGERCRLRRPPRRPSSGPRWTPSCATPRSSPQSGWNAGCWDPVRSPGSGPVTCSTVPSSPT